MVESTTMALVQVSAITAYLIVIVLLNTSIGIRLGYKPYRIIPVSFVWPLLYFKRIRNWAKYDPDDPPVCIVGCVEVIDNA